MPSPMQTESTRSATPSDAAAAASPDSHASSNSNPKTSALAKPSTSRNRENQRLSRARRKEYVSSLEARLRDYERKGSAATIEMQKAARNVLRENLQLKEQLARSLCQSCGAKLVSTENGVAAGAGAAATPGASALTSQIQDNIIETEIRRRGISGFDEMDTDRPPSQHLPPDLFRDFRPSVSLASQPPLRQLVSIASHHQQQQQSSSSEGNYYHRLPSVSSTYSQSSVSSDHSTTTASHNNMHPSHGSSSSSSSQYRPPPVVLPPPMGYPHSSAPSTSLPPISQPLQSSSYSVHSHEPSLSPRQFVPRITPDLPSELQAGHKRKNSAEDTDPRNTTDCGDALALLASYGKMELEEISRIICPPGSTCCRAKTAVRLAKAVSEVAEAYREKNSCGAKSSCNHKETCKQIEASSICKALSEPIKMPTKGECRVDNRLLFKLLDEASK